MKNHAYILALLVVMVIALALRVYHLGAQGYWLDELLSLEASAGRGQTDQALPRDVLVNPGDLTSLIAAQPWWRVWTTIEKDSHPPLYYTLLRGWRAIFGDSEIATRSLSVLFSMIDIVLIYDVGRRLICARVGLLAALLMAIAPIHVLYAQETRSYSMLIATTLACAWALIRLNDKITSWRIATLGFFLLVAMLTHYLAAPVLLAIAIITAIKFPRRVLLAFVVAAFIYLIIWSPFFYQQLDSFRRNREASADLLPGLVSRSIMRLFCIPIRQIGNPRGIGLLYVLGSIVLLIPGIVWARKLAIAWLWLILPLLFLLFTDLRSSTGTLDLPRYTFVVSPAVFLLIAAGAERLTLAALAIPTFAVVLAAINLPTSYQQWKPNWRNLAEEINRASPQSVVAITTNPAEQWWLGGAVLGVARYWPENSPRFLLLTKTSDLEQPRDIWLIEHDLDSPPSSLLPNYQIVDSFPAQYIGMVYHLRPKLP